MKARLRSSALRLGVGMLVAIFASWSLAGFLNVPRDLGRPGAKLTPPSGEPFPVIYTEPDGGPQVGVGTHPITGESLTAGCSTCHSTSEANPTHGVGALSYAFHQGMVFRHEHLSCLSCHDGNNFDQLHLADGNGVPFKSVMDLCAQCHSKQKQASDHGAHGGMNGYWDLSRGPRIRHTCTDCHDPHAPKFPQMKPSFKARDRFLDNSHAGEPHE